eukprot:CAMPEP_0116873230 /NCGR_PEP_ID=MMETSP0463-20121206/4239_1 /TAXON_ID=181622 /ORGANISM="Strombidinopsis sp, Strain SopsisLIS2011" /LENGTH=76 /DNA_ID=CAMNT_0004514761 /DNA_START=1834 /DNA_END=2061 /DNA_ORIENTATION=+
MTLPNETISYITGKEGENLKDIEIKSGAAVRISKGESGDTASQRNVYITGETECQHAAKNLIEEIITLRATTELTD